jgi:hypothetical protein
VRGERPIEPGPPGPCRVVKRRLRPAGLESQRHQSNLAWEEQSVHSSFLNCPLDPLGQSSPHVGMRGVRGLYSTERYRSMDNGGPAATVLPD